MKDEIIEQIKKLGASVWAITNPNAKNQIKQKMKKYATAYYEGTALISDLDFENLVDVLKIFDINDEYLTTPGWGYKIQNGFKHIYGKVGTLEYFYNYSELVDKLNGQKNLIITPKLDGINFVAYYQNGNFQRCLTRGNGYEGKDISWAFEDYKLSENLKDKSFAINGEAFCINVRGNSRDITASYLNGNNLKDIKNYGKNVKKLEINNKNIKFVPFGLLNIKTNYEQELNTLNEICDFKLPYNIFENLPTEKQLKEMFFNYLKEYDVDGLVITNQAKTLQVAFKFKN